MISWSLKNLATIIYMYDQSMINQIQSYNYREHQYSNTGTLHFLNFECDVPISAYHEKSHQMFLYFEARKA